MAEETLKVVWRKVLQPDELPEGRVKAVTCERRTICMTHFEGKYGALDNACPHQGGPLGEGSIEDGQLRCPWHGWDFHPLSGASPGDFEDGVNAYPISVRDDGVYIGIEEPEETERTISDLMVETMVEWGVRHVWGMVGHSNLGLADAIRRQQEAGNITYYGIRHEGAASFAASAYGKLTGRPAACLSIAGPGATNLLTGLWDANVDRSPVLALTGQVDSQVLGPGAFQEINLSAAFGKVAAWTQTVLPDSRHAELVNLALKSSILERGVSHLIFPDDVQTLPSTREAGTRTGRIANREISPPEASLSAAVEMLAAARRPVIIVGHGARFHMSAITLLAETLDCPVITTFKGKGLISDRHPLGCGVLGRSGTPIASWLMNEADCLLVLGASFSNHTGITSRKPTIQVDYDPMILGKFHAVDVPVWGEIGVAVAEITERLAGGYAAISQREEIARRWSIWRQEKASRRQQTSEKGLSSATVFDALERHTPSDAIIAVDVGNNTYSFGRYFECTEQSVVMSGYLGSIGFALPAAMGAWAATQEKGTPFHDRKVVSIAGDGGFAQYMAELTTAVKYRMNITQIVLNNMELGKISKEQRSADLDVWQTDLWNPHFGLWARNCGAMGVRVTGLEELDVALERAMAHPAPSLVEVMTDSELI